MRTRIFFGVDVKVTDSKEKIWSFLVPDLPCRVVKGDHFEWYDFVPKELEEKIEPKHYQFNEDLTHVDFVVIEIDEGEVTQSIYLGEHK